MINLPLTACALAKTKIDMFLWLPHPRPLMALLMPYVSCPENTLENDMLIHFLRIFSYRWLFEESLIYKTQEKAQAPQPKVVNIITTVLTKRARTVHYLSFIVLFSVALLNIAGLTDSWSWLLSPDVTRLWGLRLEVSASLCVKAFC